MIPILNNKIPMLDDRLMDFTGYSAVSVFALHPVIQEDIFKHVPDAHFVMMNCEISYVNIYINGRVPMLFVYTKEFS